MLATVTVLANEAGYDVAFDKVTGDLTFTSDTINGVGILEVKLPNRPSEMDKTLIGKTVSAHAVDAVNKYVATQNNTDMLATVAARAETEGYTVSADRDDGWQKQRCGYL